MAQFARTLIAVAALLMMMATPSPAHAAAATAASGFSRKLRWGGGGCWGGCSRPASSVTVVSVPQQPAYVAPAVSYAPIIVTRPPPIAYPVPFPVQTPVFVPGTGSYPCVGGGPCGGVGYGGYPCTGGGCGGPTQVRLDSSSVVTAANGKK